MNSFELSLALSEIVEKKEREREVLEGKKSKQIEDEEASEIVVVVDAAAEATPYLICLSRIFCCRLFISQYNRH